MWKGWKCHGGCARSWNVSPKSRCSLFFHYPLVSLSRGSVLGQDPFFGSSFSQGSIPELQVPSRAGCERSGGAQPADSSIGAWMCLLQPPRGINDSKHRQEPLFPCQDGLGRVCEGAGQVSPHLGACWCYWDRMRHPTEGHG